MTRCCYATIVSSNYLAYAKVLGASLRKHHADADFRVLIVERASPALRELLAQEGLPAVFAEDLQLPDLERLAYKYDVLELNTALKPSFLKLLFAQGYERVSYVDPDIRFYAAPHALDKALDDAAIVLTPHTLAPVLDGRRPSDVDFLRAGVFNLGFIGLKRHHQTQAMLDWWEQRCLSLGFNDIGFGTFVDQKWMNLVPAYFDDVKILKDASCNVAYWNLHERRISGQAEAPMVNEQALTFFHFSGVDADQPGQLSKHQTRHELSANAVLASLVGDYVRALDEAGHRRLRAQPYSFASLDDGQPISATMRRALCCEGITEPQPFAANSAFQQRLRAGGITRPSAQAGTDKPAVINTRNLEQLGAKLKVANFMVRLLARCIGVDRTLMLIRYAALLARESHFASVLLQLPLQHEHSERR